MTYPVFYHYHPQFRVALYGKKRRADRSLPLFLAARPDRICLIKAASDSSQPGFCQVLTPVYGTGSAGNRDMFADATILTDRKSGAVLFTADCCSLVVYEATTHIVGLAHCGRPAMTPQNQPGELIDNMVTRLIQAMNDLVGSNPDFSAVITGSISPENFCHNEPGARTLIKPFEQFGDIAFRNISRGELDIPGIVRHQLIRLGVNPQNIIHDNLCTYNEKELYSYRQACHYNLDRTARNAIVATLC